MREPPADFPKKLLETHCADRQEGAGRLPRELGQARARVLRASTCPKDVPKVVVYPFAGGDLSTALTVYPDADEITTMSLEPAGDPRPIGVLKGGDLDARAQEGRVRAQVPLPRELQQHAEHDRRDARRLGADQADVRLVRAQDPRLRARLAALLQASTTTARSTTSTTPTSRRRRDPLKAQAEKRNRCSRTTSCVPQARRPRPDLSPHPAEPRQRSPARRSPGGARVPQRAPGEDRGDDEGRELSAVVGRRSR